MIKLFEQGGLRNDSEARRPSMPANDFFEYCKIAYIAGQRKNDHVDKNLSGRELYKIYADGRHEGLLDIDGNSPEEFADWLDGKHPKRERGGHPWEFKRGGHTNLYVSRSYGEKDFAITLCAGSSGLKESLSMFLAIHEAGLPIAIGDPEGKYKQLLGQDNIGIIACHDILQYAENRFHEHEFVHDVIYYDDFGKYKNRI